MTRPLFILVAAALASGALVQTQEPAAFKLGTFERAGKVFVGIVVADARVIDLAAAHAAVPASGAPIAAPADMKDLIGRYEAGLGARIAHLVTATAAASRGGTRPPYVHDLTALETLPPIMYPTTMVNVAVNYTEHAVEMGLRDGTPGAPVPPGSAPPGTTSAPGIWVRAPSDTRWNPFMFLKATSAIIAHGETIRIPVARERIDFECELGVVIGRQASHVPAAAARDYIFGYTIQNDVSDRGGRGDSRFGSDWLVGKSHDTFAPLGPFIVPRQFIADPQALKITAVLNGQPFQEGRTAQMIHDVYEQIAYASAILTLRPGDIIATGTPPGVGSARQPPVYLKHGDTVSCTYEGVGTLTNPAMSAAREPAR